MENSSSSRTNVTVEIWSLKGPTDGDDLVRHVAQACDPLEGTGSYFLNFPYRIW